MITYILIITLAWGKSSIIIPDFKSMKECTEASNTIAAAQNTTLQYTSSCIKQTR